MKVSVLSAGIAAALVTLGAAGLGCEAESRFFIVQNQVPGPGGCLIPGERGHTFRGHGRLDAGLVGSGNGFAYAVFPLLQNDLPPVGEVGGVERNRLTVTGFSVTLELDPAAPPAARKVFDDLAADETGRRLLSFEEPFAGTLEPNGSTIGAGVGAIRSEVVRQLRAANDLTAGPLVRITIALKARAHSVNGAHETPVFRFPVDLCDGCLIAGEERTCPISSQRHAGNPCNIAQDQVVDCCTDAGRLRCPAPVMQMNPFPFPIPTTPAP